MLSTSALYELIEWVGGEYLGEDQAKAFLATQQDPWDAQKDMALAFFGAIFGLLFLPRQGATVKHGELGEREA